MAPQPAHFQQVRLIGTVKDVIVTHGKLMWIIVAVDVHEPCVGWWERSRTMARMN
jgi:hypothetical protein